MSEVAIALSFQGKVTSLEGVTPKTTGQELYARALHALNLSDETSLKILVKGKRLADDENPCGLEVGSSRKPLKLLVMATSAVVVADLASKRSDPTIRGFDQEEQSKRGVSKYLPWGPAHVQDKNYKFCRFQACTWQSFGHRIDDAAPHAFAAMQLLERLSMDPGVVHVMKERELVVGTLGEMDPIDDRVMQKKQSQGACLLGYNTNGGARIDIKLRTDDLKGFRPYPELVATLLHELSHNWVGEHNLLFWTNLGQMRAEYLTSHRALQSTLANGKTTAELAGLNESILESIPEAILNELVQDMAQHGLHPRLIEAPIRRRCQELQDDILRGKKLGGSDGKLDTSGASARERALQAAEQRRKQQEKGPDSSSSSR